MKCNICKREMIDSVNCGGDCIVCMADIAEDPECKKIVESYREKPDGDAEILGYEDGEAPTKSSAIWKYINNAKRNNDNDNFKRASNSNN